MVVFFIFKITRSIKFNVNTLFLIENYFKLDGFFYICKTIKNILKYS